MITRYQFAVALLDALGASTLEGSIDAVVAWETMENTKAINNPLATKWNMEVPGESAFNPEGVQNYPTINVGLNATLNTLKMSDYDSLRAALAAGDYATITAAIDASLWGTKNVSSVPESQAQAEYKEPIASADTLDSIPLEPGVPSAPPAPTTYTIRPDDTLWGIAERFNVPGGWKALYDANAQRLNAAAVSRGFGSSNGGRFIWPGTVIEIP